MDHIELWKQEEKKSARAPARILVLNVELLNIGKIRAPILL